MDNNKEKLTPLKAIKAHCLDCCCGQIREVDKCPIPDCPLYPFRKGKNPYRTGRKEYTEEERAAVAERLSKYRKTRKKEEQ